MNKKKCASCSCEKDLQDFNKRASAPDGLQFSCRVCTKLQYRKHYVTNKATIHTRVAIRKRSIKKRLDEYKSTLACVKCGEDTPVCLDFHHVDDNKEFGISKSANEGISWNKIITEIDKCVVLCSNCHRKVHAGLLLV